MVAMGPRILLGCDIGEPWSAVQATMTESLSQQASERHRLENLYLIMEKTSVVLRSLKEQEHVEMHAISELVELGEGYNSALAELGTGIVMKVAVLTFVLHGHVSFPLFMLATSAASLAEHVIKRIARMFLRRTAEQRLDEFTHDENASFFMKVSALSVSCLSNWKGTWPMLLTTIRHLITGEIIVKLVFDMIRFFMVLFHKWGQRGALRISRKKALEHAEDIHRLEAELVAYRADVQKMITDIEVRMHEEDEEGAQLSGIDELMPPPPPGSTTSTAQHAGSGVNDIAAAEEKGPSVAGETTRRRRKLPELPPGRSRSAAVVTRTWAEGEIPGFVAEPNTQSDTTVARKRRILPKLPLLLAPPENPNTDTTTGTGSTTTTSTTTSATLPN